MKGMRSSITRALLGFAGITATLTVPIALASPAAALGTLAGPATVMAPGGVTPLSSGDSADLFTLDVPLFSACPGDANAGYSVQGYMVSAAIDPATIVFAFGGPAPTQFGPPQATFRQPLYDEFGTPYVASPAAAEPPAVEGNVINIPTFSYRVFEEAFLPDVLPAGVYNIGVACVFNGAEITRYWNVQVTFTVNAGDGFANRDWFVGAVASPPTLDSVTASPDSCTANFTAGLSDPAATSFTATATPSGGGTATIVSGAGSPITIAGLATATTYDVVVTATNAVGESAPSNTLQCTPAVGARNPVQGLMATPGALGSGEVTLDWSPPAPDSPPSDPVSYDITTTAAGIGPFSVPFGTNTYTVTGLPLGTFDFTVTPVHSPAPNGTSSTVTATLFSAQVLLQHIDVNRPAGALVLTQVCGANGEIPEDPPSVGFPAGLPLVPADTDGFAPTLTEDGSDPDPEFDEYPNPSPVSYPTHCGLDLGVAQLVDAGEGAGQFFAADGVLNQVTVVDTRDDDIGWTINGTMGAFVANGGTDTFSGDQLGWDPLVTDDSDPYTPPGGGTYDQVATAGPSVAPNTAGGLGDGETLASAAAGSAIGTAVLDARVKLLIPATADAGDYEGTLTITSV